MGCAAALPRNKTGGFIPATPLSHLLRCKFAPECLLIAACVRSGDTGDAAGHDISTSSVAASGCLGVHRCGRYQQPIAELCRSRDVILIRVHRYSCTAGE